MNSFMKTFADRLYQFSCHFIQVCSLLLTALLFLSAFLLTCYTANMESQLVLTKWDNPLWGLLGIACFLFVAGFIRHFISPNPSKRKTILLILVLIWCISVGMAFLFLGRTMPSADCMSVFSMAEELAAGNTSVIHPTDSYISYYPQQVGLIAFYELIVRIWNVLPFGVRAYPAIQALNVLLACVIIFTQYKTVQLLWHSDTADCIYLLLAGLNIPLLMYTSFVYGEIPSFAAVSVGCYYFLKFLSQKERNRLVPVQGLISLLSLTLGVMLRKNSLILVIAVLIVALLQALRERKPLLLIYALLCVICSLSILPLIQSMYEHRSGNTIRSGVPAMAYFAMGMQESSRADGWYNGFNFYTYQDTGMDTEATVALSKQAIRERLHYFREHPGYAAQFYRNKYLSQWADGTYACRQATYATSGGRVPIMNSVYTGTAAKLLVTYCNLYQNILYLGAFSFCIFQLHSKRGGSCSKAGFLPVYLGLIGVIGGLLFHFIWEANARYIFLYSLLLLPYAARGLEHLTVRQETLSPKKRFLPLCVLLALSLLFVCFSAWHNKDSAEKEAQLQRLKSESYNGLFLAMYSLENYQEEDFSTYRGISSLILTEPARDTREISDYLKAAFTSGNTVTNVWLGLDPCMIRSSSEREDQGEQNLSRDILSYIAANPDTDFDILFPYYSSGYWIGETPTQMNTMLASYASLAQTLFEYPNVTVFFPGGEPWLIANPYNYMAEGILNKELSHKLILLTFCDHNYVLTPDTATDYFSDLQKYLSSEQDAPAVYPDLSDWDIVFFGDSIIGNYTASDSIPGVIEGLSSARTYNCAQGGTPAAFTNGDLLCFSLSIDYFVSQNTDAVSDYDPFYPALQRFVQDDHEGHKLLFIINYGLNDYFDGLPVENPEDAYDVTSYAGALRNGVLKIREAYPDAEILLMAPGFTTYFTNGTEITTQEGGSLLDYVNAAVTVAGELNTLSMDNYHDLGVDETNEGYYLSDGCHFNERGRFLVARNILERLTQDISPDQ